MLVELYNGNMDDTQEEFGRQVAYYADACAVIGRMIGIQQMTDPDMEDVCRSTLFILHTRGHTADWLIYAEDLMEMQVFSEELENKMAAASDTLQAVLMDIASADARSLKPVLIAFVDDKETVVHGMLLNMDTAAVLLKDATPQPKE